MNVTVFLMAGLVVVQRNAFCFMRYFFRAILERTMKMVMRDRQSQRIVGWMLLWLRMGIPVRYASIEDWTRPAT